MDLPELLQFERALERGTVALLAESAANVYGSREVDTAQSPRIEVKAIVGEALQQRHRFASGEEIFASYTGVLELTIKTNRTGEDKSQAHHKLLGQTRARLQMFAAVTKWRLQNSTLLLDDIREAGTSDSFVDADDIDVSIIAHNIRFSIHPNAWPTNL